MKKVALFTLLSFATFTARSVVAQSSTLARDPNLSLRRLALVASSNDGGPNRVRLRFADSDARAIAEVLQHLGGLRADDLELLPGATRAALQTSFARLRSTLMNAPRGKSRRELVIYYSGHSDETGLLLGSDHVSYQDLREWLDATGADVRIAILDSCASGALLRSRGGTLRASFLSDVSVDTRGHAFLTASSANEVAQESDRIGAAFFTHYLVSGLRGAADTNRDGRVTLGEAYQFAYHETLGRTAQTVAGPQHPAYDIQLVGTGDLVLTDLHETKASLVLEENVAGRVYVRDGSGRLLVELRKDPLYPVELGFGAGDYRVVLDRDGHHFAASVSLQDGKATRLGMAQFGATKALVATTRGAIEASEAAPAPAPAADRRSLGDKLIGETSLIGQTRELGGYAGLGFRYTQLGGTDGFLATLDAALLINRRYAIGLSSGGGISGRIDNDGNRLAMGYAGALARYHFLFDSPLSFSLGAVAGGGGVTIEDKSTNAEDDSRGDAFFLFEPQLAGHVDVTRFARIGVDFGYRFIAGADRHPTSDLRGFTGGFHVGLGWF
jgi:hypothetical protein